MLTHIPAVWRWGTGGRNDAGLFNALTMSPEIRLVDGDSTGTCPESHIRYLETSLDAVLTYLLSPHASRQLSYTGWWLRLGHDPWSPPGIPCPLLALQPEKPRLRCVGWRVAPHIDGKDLQRGLAAASALHTKIWSQLICPSLKARYAEP